MRNYFLFIALLFLNACASTDAVPVNDEYIKAIDAYSDGDVQYLGAYNNFKYRATIINSAIQQTLIEKKGEVYLWDAPKKQVELAKMQNDNGAQTTVFLSFFTPNRLDDNLSTKKSIWYVYLETSKGRYEGKITKDRTSLTELNVLFPYHNRFSTAYQVRFPVPVSQIEGEQNTLTITGPLGVKSVKFPARF